MNTSAWRLLMLAAICSLALLLAANWQSAVANPAAVRPATSIALIDVNRLIGSLHEVQELGQRLQADFNKRRRELEEIATRIRDIDSDLEMMRDQRSTARIERLGQKFEAEQQLEARRKVLQRLVDLQEGEMTRGIVLKVVASAERLAERDGWDLILFDDRDLLRVPAEGHIFGEQMNQLMMARRIAVASDRIDITDQLITMMNNEFKAAQR
jgi:Skp family chaperone for outer membrane proteins